MILKTSMKSLVLCCFVLICVGLARSGRDFSDFEYEGTFDNSVDQENYRTNSDELEGDSLVGNIPSGGASHEGEYGSPIREKYGKKMHAEGDKTDDSCVQTCGVAQDVVDGDVKCVKGETGNIQCTCKNERLLFDSDGKTCKESIPADEDYCKEEFKNCKETGGSCTATKGSGVDEIKVDCVCPPNLVYKAGTGCAVTDTACDEKIANCRSTKGSCILNGKKEIECDCPDLTEYDGQKGCKVTDNGCDENIANCRATKGSCILNDNKEIECDCPKNTLYVNSKKGCIALEVLCETEKPRCSELGSCSLNNKKEIKCDCPLNSVYKDDKGCVVTEGRCMQVIPKCTETKGHCIIGKDKQVECSCSKFAKYVEQKGCEVYNDTCESHKPNCTATKGYCLVLDEDEIYCKCPKDSVYDDIDQTGCRISAEKCDEYQPECRNTGGLCTEDYDAENVTVQCNCSENSTYEYNIGCKVPDDVCDSEMKMCRGTTGICVMGISNQVQCKCPGDSTFDEKKGCIVSTEMCNKFKPGCLDARGSCHFNKETGVQCDCPEKSTYTDGIGCKVSDDICKEKIPECRTTNGSCIWPDGNIQCECSDKSKFQAGEGCNVSDTTCDKSVPRCRDTGGSCGWSEKVQVQCSCPKNSSYVTNKGCIVLKKICDESYPECLRTGGLCRWTDATDVNCVCPRGAPYNNKKGCKVPEKICMEEQNNCLSTSGFCIWKDESTECKCPKNSKYEKNIGCKLTNESCEAEKKGCIGSKGYCLYRSNKIVHCQCPKNKTHIKDEGACVDDPCIGTCGVPHQVVDRVAQVYCHGLNSGSTPKCMCLGSNKAFDSEKKKCEDDQCSIQCGVKYGSDGEEMCEGGPFGNVTCKCASKDFHFDESVKKCKQNCFDSENNSSLCQNSGKCEKDSKRDVYFCNCPPGVTGGFCEVTECSGKFKDCNGDKGECLIDEKRGAYCKCNGTKKLNPKLNYCEEPCTENDQCKGRKTCINGFCACEEGRGGDNCEKATGCDVIMETLCGSEATCIFDKDEKNKATCECKDPAYYYDTDEMECKDIFCNKNNPCGEEAECVYDKSTHTGTCKCKGEKYYDYNSGKCEEPDKCFLRKTPCDKNERCENGKCVCAGKMKNETCVGNSCKADSCFGNAVCNEKDQCDCKSGFFFNGATCKDAVCISKDTLGKCPCPSGMKKEEKEGPCVANDGVNRCESNCGLGYCVKDKDGNDTCKCVNMATLDSDTGICILKEKEVCGTQKLTEDKEKCNCTGKFTQSEDGITCRLINCDDKEAKEDCESKGASCIMWWKKDRTRDQGYDCKCPDSYEMEDGKCKDPCSLKEFSEKCLKLGQVCYNTLTEENKLKDECRCPPSLKPKDGKCSDIAENAYLITNIFVLKNKYLKTGKEIDKVKLNSDLIKSMQKTFSDAYEYGYLYKVQPKGDNALNCSVYINFKEGHGSEIKRIQFQAKKVDTSGSNEYEENVYLWPPSVLLAENNFKEDDYKKLEFCSDVVKNSMCGNHATCSKVDNKYECSCGKGFKPVLSSIQDKGKFRIQICEDIDECSPVDPCSENSQCENIPGDYRCKCKPGFKKGKTSDLGTDKSGCTDLCSPSPCDKGSCVLKGDGFDCQCEAGFEGSLCDRSDDRFKSAKQSTVIVGAVLGTILGVGLIAFIIFYKKTKKNSGSEDFMAAPRMEHAEMAERRPARGVVNKSYE